ncbi:serum amyloid P-component-like [Solea solea]|uniref:serum amyloid P-component-like n=1 Tax=Solea solea TaxID=90069 RepID=UPI00272ABD98|nr:serum amyloid P-component-like [Solea solea]
MNLLLVLVMLTACAADPQDMSGKMFIFPMESKSAYVKLITSQQEFRDVTVCHRSFTDLRRSHGLFSMSTRGHPNDFAIFWDNANKEMEAHVRDLNVQYNWVDYKPNMWHSICTTWDSASGIVQLWFDGQPLIKRFLDVGSNIISGTPIIILGQEQDSHGGGFDAKQSLVGMMADVHMWNSVLSPCEIQKYVYNLNFTRGDVINWSALEYQIFDKVLVENTVTPCAI